MDTNIDHYRVLGLPSGEEGSKLTEKEINKAYKFKALELHPDKRLDDPNAATNFQQLRTSYDILKDEKARKLFDGLLRAMHAKKSGSGFDSKKESASSGGDGGGVDQEKVLKVSWEKVGEDYSADKLRELFSKFGEVENVVIKERKKKVSAIVVMATKQGAVATIGNVIGNLANPLLVLPLKPAMPADAWGASKSVEPEAPSKLVGAGYQAFEESVLMKLQKAAAKQR